MHMTFDESTTQTAAVVSRRNVWEWVAEACQADYYSRPPVRNPVGPTKFKSKIHKAL